MKLKAISLFVIILTTLTFGFLSFKEGHATSTHYVASPPIQNYTTNPPTNKTGAPGESTCTDCHSGSILSSAGVVDFDFSGQNSSYIPGQTYDLSISVLNGNKNGFQAIILDANNQKAGSFTNGSNTNTVLSNGKEYIRQSSASGITNFEFQWTAPTNNAGNLTAYYSFNKSNADGTTSGDLIYIGNQTINSTSTSSISKNEINPLKVNAFWNPNTKQIHVEYTINERAKIMVNVQSLSGQLIQSTTIGNQDAGQHDHLLKTNNIPTGMYIVSTFIGNRVHNKKLMIYGS